MANRLLIKPFAVALLGASFTLFANSTAQTKPGEWTPEVMLRLRVPGNVRVSPDGERVAFTLTEAMVAGEKSEYLTRIYIANSNGSGQLQLTRGEHSATDPQWSPDGKWIAFISNRTGKSYVWIFSADLSISKDVSRVERLEILEANNPVFDEPTLGAVVKDTFYWIANSQWGAIDDKGQLAPPEKLQDPIVLKSRLNKPW